MCRDRTRANASCCGCRARCAAAEGSFLFALCYAQVCFAIDRLILLQSLASDLASPSEQRLRHALRVRTFATGLLLLPSTAEQQYAQQDLGLHGRAVHPVGVHRGSRQPE